MWLRIEKAVRTINIIEENKALPVSMCVIIGIAVVLVLTIAILIILLIREKKKNKQNTNASQIFVTNRKTSDTESKNPMAFNYKMVLIPALLMLGVVSAYLFCENAINTQLNIMYDGIVAKIQGNNASTKYNITDTNPEDAEDISIDEEKEIENANKEDIDEQSVETEVVLFGKYEQDNDLKNGKEDIEWIVLERDGQGATLISKYVLDCKQWGNPMYVDQWSESEMRDWLNDVFVSRAFSKEEQSRLLTKVRSTDGELTSDKVILLSLDEVKEYMPEQEDRISEATDYAVERGTNVSLVNGMSWWWLRDLDNNNSYVLTVNNRGSVGWTISAAKDSMNGGIRPVIYIPTSAATRRPK